MSLFALEAVQIASPVPPPDADGFAQDMAAVQFAHELAVQLDAPVREVWFSLCNLPADLLVMLQSPQGWSALGAVIAFDLGIPAHAFEPLVH